MAVAQSSSGGVAMLCTSGFFWMTSCVQMWPGTGNARKAYTQSDSTTRWQHGFHALAYTQTDSPSAYFKV